MKKIFTTTFTLFAVIGLASVALLAQQQRQLTPEQQAQLQAQQAATKADHQRMLDLLGIKELRPGANGSNKEAPNFANYDEAKVKPYSPLPDPLTLKNGKKVTSAKVWWSQRRAEIVEDFDREMYGRTPKVTPKVKWEVTSTTNEEKYGVPVVTKQLTGHVDNSSYPAVTVDIKLTLTTPVKAVNVPVIMELMFQLPPRP
ncbi:MAG TPA: acetylxylan esterase, partial [Blastocatellia bacterium]|nr:acetylxylan esterase [Blastocatellia bacterium]